MTSANPTLRELLADGKYTRWAADYTDEQLAAVLWLVGEFTGRASRGEFDNELAEARAGYKRKYAALNGLVAARSAARTEPPSLDDVRSLMREALRGDKERHDMHTLEVDGARMHFNSDMSGTVIVDIETDSIHFPGQLIRDYVDKYFTPAHDELWVKRMEQVGEKFLPAMLDELKAEIEKNR